MAADLSSMINYAQHDLGGITRKIYLFAVPEVNLYRFHAETRFDSKFQDATLHLTLGVTNQSKSTVEGAELRLRLTDPEGKPVTLPRVRCVCRRCGRVKTGCRRWIFLLPSLCIGRTSTRGFTS